MHRSQRSWCTRTRRVHLRADSVGMKRWVSAPAVLRAGLAACLLVATPAPCARATTLLAPVAGARDAAMAGSTVAAPADAMSAFFLNPAGLTLLERPVATFGCGFFPISTRVRTPFGYDEESS